MKAFSFSTLNDLCHWVWSSTGLPESGTKATEVMGVPLSVNVTNTSIILSGKEWAIHLNVITDMEDITHQYRAANDNMIGAVVCGRLVMIDHRMQFHGSLDAYECDLVLFMLHEHEWRGKTLSAG